MRASWLTAVSLVAVLDSARADTVVSPGPVGGQTWTASGSPYRLTGPVTVAAGTTLTVEPGVEVIADHRLAGLEVTVRVDGALHAEGTPAAPIVWDAANGQADGWAGFGFEATATYRLRHVTLRHATYGLRSWAVDSGLVEHVTVDEPGTFGVWIRRGTFTATALTITGAPFIGLQVGDTNGDGAIVSIDRPVFERNRTGINIDGTSRVTIENGVIRGSDWSGVVLQSLQGGELDLVHTTIVDSGDYGVEVASDQGSIARVRGSIVARSGTADLAVTVGRGRIDVRDSILWPGRMTGAVLVGPGIQTTDPKFVSVDDLHLAADSPAIDASADGPARDADDRVRPADGDGDGIAGYDLGAFEYPAAVDPEPEPSADGCAASQAPSLTVAMFALWLRRRRAQPRP